MHIVAPSLLSANMLHLSAEIEMLNESKAKWLHFDVMDGVFVPNISFGFPILKAIRPLTSKIIDVHLMIHQYDSFITEFKNAGADQLTVHFENSIHLHRTIQLIKATGMKAGVAINPHTPVDSLSDIIGDIDLVILMSVNPGYGGQKFIENTYAKISELKALITLKSSHARIEVDGGVDLSNYKKIINAGADAIVAGNAVFSSATPLDTIHQLSQL